GPDHHPAARLAAPHEPHLPVRGPRSLGGRVHQRSGRGDVPGQDRRAGEERRPLPPAAPPLYGVAALGDPGPRPRPPAHAHRAEGRRAEPGESAYRLPLPSTLLHGARGVRPRGAIAAGGAPAPVLAMPLRARAPRGRAPPSPLAPETPPPDLARHDRARRAGAGESPPAGATRGENPPADAAGLSPAAGSHSG